LVGDPLEAMSNRIKLMPSMFLGGSVGPHQAEDPVGVVGIGRPYLLDRLMTNRRRRFRRVCSEARSDPHWAPNSPGTSGSGRRDLRQVFLLLRVVPYFRSAGPSMEMPTRSAAGARRSRPFSWRRILVSSPSRPPPPYSWANAARSSPCRASARTRRAAARRRIWCCGRPEDVLVRGHRPPHLRRALACSSRGFAAKFFQIGHRRFHGGQALRPAIEASS